MIATAYDRNGTAARTIDITDPDNPVPYTREHRYQDEDDGPRYADLTPFERRARAQSADWTPAQRIKKGFPAVLDRATLMSAAPSVFAATPWQGMSSKYRFVPTTVVLDMMAAQDLLPVRVAQSKTRIEGKGEYTRHLVRFRHRDHIILPDYANTVNRGMSRTNPYAEVPEIVLTNSHDGSSAYTLWAGLMRLVCLNGLMIDGDTLGSFSVRHSGREQDFESNIIGSTHAIAESAPRALETITAWKQIELTPPVAQVMAEAALELRDEERLRPQQILQARREEDRTPSLWATFNKIQENMMKGGQTRPDMVNPETGRLARKSTTRAIKSVGEETRLNRALWKLGERMAQLAS